MSITQAMADLAAATGTEHLGREMVIDGRTVAAVKRSLTIEEAQVLSVSMGMGVEGMGMRVEGMRITVDKTLLAKQPARGGKMTVDGHVYEVTVIAISGNRLRLTLVRYLN